MMLSEIETRLQSAASRCAQLLPADQLEEIDSLIRAGEPGVALENLCTQLYEYDVKVPAELMIELATLGSAMKLDAKYWMRLTSSDIAQSK